MPRRTRIRLAGKWEARERERRVAELCELERYLHCTWYQGLSRPAGLVERLNVVACTCLQASCRVEIRISMTLPGDAEHLPNIN